MIETLAAICELQPRYSSENTPAMQERGRLIRQVLKSEIEGIRPQLAAALGPYGNDLGVEASDGIGRKTEAPWVRFFSRSMSPRPTEGFYVVIHFTRDGSAYYITVGCGSTVFKGGSLIPVADEELARRRAWARAAVVRRLGSLDPFVDEIHLGAIASLPRTFEKATSFAKRVQVNSLNDGDLIDLLVQAARALRIIYAGQRIGANLTIEQQIEVEVDERIRPVNLASKGQGFRLSAKERRAIELRAMGVSIAHLISLDFKVKDVSQTASYDLEAEKGGTTIKVEVKGTTGFGADAVLMSRNEVDLHSRERGSTALFIVSEIKLSRSQDGELVAKGGVLTALFDWDISEWELIPMSYMVRRRAKTLF